MPSIGSLKMNELFSLPPCVLVMLGKQTKENEGDERDEENDESDGKR